MRKFNLKIFFIFSNLFILNFGARRSQFVQSLLLSTFAALCVDDTTPAPPVASKMNVGVPPMVPTPVSVHSSTSGGASSLKATKSHKHSYKGGPKAPSYARRHVPPGGVPSGAAAAAPKDGKHGDDAR